MLERLKLGEVTVDEVLKNLKNLPYEDLGFARIIITEALDAGAGGNLLSR